MPWTLTQTPLTPAPLPSLEVPWIVSVRDASIVVRLDGAVILTVGAVMALEPVHVEPAFAVLMMVSLSPTTIQ